MILTLLYVFSFLSFNTKAMMPDDRRLEPLVELVNNADADFVFLTEEYTGQVRTMLGDRYEYAESARSHIDLTERFYSKYPIVDVKDIAPLQDGKYTDVWVHRVRVAVKGDTLNLYCCHLPHDTGDRMTIVNGILGDIATTNGRAIVGGDMNSLSLSSPIQAMLRGGLHDCWAEKGQGSSATFHELPIGVRIDYILRTGSLTTRSITRLSGNGISDHDALCASFDIPAPGDTVIAIPSDTIMVIPIDINKLKTLIQNVFSL